MSAPAKQFVRTRWTLIFAFGALVVLLVIRLAVAIQHEESVRVEVESIVRNTMKSIQLIDRVEKDIEHEHLLQEAHVRARTPAQMDVIERQMAEAEADYAEAATLFDQLPANPEEAILWRQMQTLIAQIRQPLAEIQALSRQNRDEEAQTKLDAIEPRYADVRQLASALTRVDDSEANTTLSRVASLQQSLVARTILTGLFGALATLLVGWMSIHIIGRREKALLQHAGELEQRNRELDAFAGRVAHDFRGPLATLSVATSRLTRRHPDERELTEPFQRVFTRMENLIQDLLALSRIDTDAQARRCNPQPVAAELQRELRPRLDTTGATLHVDVEPSLVQCSDGLLRQALWNLAENALNYGKPGVRSEVDIRGRVRGDHYELRVSDNGVGISDEDQRHVFEPFYRGSRTAEKPGTGLGLSIVKRVVEANDGTIAITSQTGRGTTFVMNLPLSAQQAAHPT